MFGRRVRPGHKFSEQSIHEINLWSGRTQRMENTIFLLILKVDF